MPCSSSTFSRCDSTAGATPRSDALKSWNLHAPHQQIADDQQRPALAEKLQRPRDRAGLPVFLRHGASIRLIIKKIVTTIFIPVNISALFVRRPIATSLLMLAVALFGVLAYAALPVSDLPSIDFPTLSVGAGLPGGDPETLASSIASPLERQFTAIAGLDSMTSSSALGTHQRHAAVRSRSQHRRRGGRRADRHRRGAAAAAAGHAVGADLPQGQPGRSADLRHRPQLRHAAALRDRQLRADADRAAGRGAQRRRAGQRARRPEVRRPRAGRSRSAARAGDRHQRDRPAAAELRT